jgi:hypothetical protein
VLLTRGDPTGQRYFSLRPNQPPAISHQSNEQAEAGGEPMRRSRGRTTRCRPPEGHPLDQLFSLVPINKFLVTLTELVTASGGS